MVKAVDAGEYHTCRGCKEVLPLDRFGYNKKQDNYYNYCKSCRSNWVNMAQKEKRQKIYEERFQAGDPLIAFCDCGNYFLRKHQRDKYVERKVCHECGRGR